LSTTAVVVVVVFVIIIPIIIIIATVVSSTVQVEKDEAAWVTRVSLDGHESAVVHNGDEDHLVGRLMCVSDSGVTVVGGVEVEEEIGVERWRGCA
jgi:hypothetical protein